MAKSDNTTHNVEPSATGEDQDLLGDVVSAHSRSKDILEETTVRVISSRNTTQCQSQMDCGNIAEEQKKDPKVMEIKKYLSDGVLLQDLKIARKLALRALQFSLFNGVVYRTGLKSRHNCVVVPHHLREELLRVTHAGKYSGHFSGRRLFDTLITSWWWETMRAHAQSFAKSCPECVVATGAG